MSYEGMQYRNTKIYNKERWKILRYDEPKFEFWLKEIFKFNIYYNSNKIIFDCGRNI